MKFDCSKKCCPHEDCARYRGKDIPCDWTGVHCNVHKPGRGLPGLYDKDAPEIVLNEKKQDRATPLKKTYHQGVLF